MKRIRIRRALLAAVAGVALIAPVAPAPATPSGGSYGWNAPIYENPPGPLTPPTTNPICGSCV